MSMTDLLFSFKGRLNRKPYWLATIAIIVIVIVLVLGAIIMDEDAVIGIVDAPSISGLLIVLLILYIPLAWIGLALAAKRLHDRDKSAWWVIVFYVIPTILNFIGDRAGGAGIILSLISLGITIWAFVELGCLRGTVGPNRYGPDPLSPTA
jgi:uncharacterized membrane protein YhaH (DUF805 family)